MWRPTGNAAHTVRIRIVVKTKMLENLTFYLDSFDLKLFQVDEGQGDDNIDHTFVHFSPSKFLSKRLTCIQNLTRSGCSSYSSCPGYNDQ